MLSLDGSNKIEEFQQALARLREALNMGNVIYDAFVSARMSNIVENMCEYELHPFIGLS